LALGASSDELGMDEVGPAFENCHAFDGIRKREICHLYV